MHDNRINIYWALIVTSYTFAHLLFVPNSWGERLISDSGFFDVLTVTIVSVALIQLLRIAYFVTETDLIKHGVTIRMHNEILIERGY